MNAFFRALFCAILAAGLCASALADEQSEDYVSRNLTEILRAISASDMSTEQQRTMLDAYIDKLVDQRRIARFVIGRYGRSLSEQEFARYQTTFFQYTQAIYFQRIRRYAGASFKILGSVDIKPGDSVVQTEIHAVSKTRPTRIDWRVRRDADTDSYRILDMGLRFDDNQIWLAQQQREQFTLILEKENGNIDELIARMHEIIARYSDEG